MLHQHVLKALPNVPRVDHTRVAAFGFRFGANVAVRLAYLEAPRLKAVACTGPVVHALLSDPQRQSTVPEMYLDVLASRLGMHDASDEALRVELNRYSLKVQGLLGRRCPTPMLSGFWKNDPFSPEEESRLITTSSSDGKLIEIPLTRCTAILTTRCKKLPTGLIIDCVNRLINSIDLVKQLLH